MFEGKTVSDTLAAVLMKDPDLSAVPAKSRRLVQACLERDPKKRLRDIGESWRLLESGTGLQPVIPQARSLSHWIVIGALAAALAVIAFLHFRETSPEQRTVRFQITPPDKASIQEFALSPDGRYLAFIDQLDASRRLWIRALDTLEARVLP